MPKLNSSQKLERCEKQLQRVWKISNRRLGHLLVGDLGTLWLRGESDVNTKVGVDFSDSTCSLKQECIFS